MLFCRKILSSENETVIEIQPSQILLDFYKNPCNSLGQQVLYVLQSIVWHFMDKAQVSSIRWNDFGQGSYYNHNLREIRFDPALVKNKTELTNLQQAFQLKFVASHEVSHALITRYASLIKDLLPDSSEITEIGFSSLCNAVEDPRVNNWAKANYVGVKDWQKAAYDPSFAVENAIMSAGAAAAIIRQLGYPPKFVIYQSELIRYWHTGQFSTHLDPTVQALLEKTKEHFSEAYSILPANRDSADIQQAAERSFRLVYEKIWHNGYKELLEEVKDLEKINQALQSENTAPKIWDTLSKKEKRELLDNMQETLERMNPEDLDKLAQKQTGQAGRIDPNKLSLKLKEKIEKIIQTFNQEVQQQLEKKAEEALGQTEDALNDEYESELNGDKMPRHSAGAKADVEKDTAEERKAADAQNAAAVLAEINRIAQQPVSHDRLNKYDRVLMELGPQIDQLVHDLEQILRANESPRYTSGHDSGQRINMDRAMQFEADPAQYKIFDKRRTPTSRDFKFTLLLDMSGSMEGENIEAAFQGLVFLCEAFQRLNLPVEIIGFSNFSATVKTIQDPLDARMRQKLSDLTKFTIDNRYFGGGTDDADAIEYAYRRIKVDPRELNFLIVITDGQGQDLRPIMREIETEQLISSPIGLGLGAGTEYVTNSYRIGISNIKPQDLGRAFAELMRDIVENPFKYSGDRHYAANFSGSAGAHFVNNLPKESENE
jgi:uncharacterized protein with von Willebrand factor type A (vWA) domain